MLPRNTSLFHTSLFLVVIVLALTGAYAQAALSPVGTWQVIVTPDSGTPSSALLTFYNDHNLIATSTNEQGVTQGGWSSGKGGTFTIMGFQWEFDPFNVFDGTLEISASFTLDPKGQHLTGRFQVEFHDLTGALLSTQVGSWTGTRIPSSEEPGPE